MRHIRPDVDESNLRSKTLNRNREFFDKSFLIIGIFVVVALVLALKTSNLTRGLYSVDSAEDQSSVAERIRPVGKIYRSGDEVRAGDLQVLEVAQAEPVAAVMSGPQVYNAACIACHGNGIGGAPTTGDGAAWQPRVAQGDDALYLHAIEGYTGSTGFMPEKGGRLDLSDNDVRGAVDYMVSELRD